MKFPCSMILLAGLTTGVSAQSSITVYGVMDATLRHGKGSISSPSEMGSGGHTTSRIGFRGIEDLGGGLKAGFVLETQIAVDTGESQGTNTNNQTTGVTTGFSWARRSTVSLIAPWGEVRLGRDFTAHYRNRVEVDPFGNAGVGAAQPFAGSIGGVISTRASNMLGYFLPSDLGGLYGQLQHYRGDNPTGTATSHNGNGSTVRLGYILGPVNLSVAYGKTEYATTATAGDITSMNVGVQYRLGASRLMAGLYRDEVARTTPLKAKGWTLGGSVPVGQHEFKLALSQYGTNAATQPKTRKLATGYVYHLSKRSAIYTTLARVDNSGGASVALNQAVTAANSGSTGLDMGFRHLY